MHISIYANMTSVTHILVRNGRVANKTVVHMSRNDIIASYMHDYTSTTTTEPTSIDSLAGLDTQSRQNTPPP